MRKLVILATALTLAAACTKEDEEVLDPKTNPETRGSMTNDSTKTDSVGIGFVVNDEWDGTYYYEF